MWASFELRCVCLASMLGCHCSLIAQDPPSPQMVYGARLGSQMYGTSNAIAADPAGFLYVGSLASGPEPGAPACASVLKLNQSGSAATWFKCLPQLTSLTSLAVDAFGNVYVTGPTAGAKTAQSTVLKISSDASKVNYSVTVMGGETTTISVDQYGNAYVAGYSGPGFVPTPGAYSSAAGPTFLEKLDPTGNVVLATYTDLAESFGVAGDSLGRVWVVGETCLYGSCKDYGIQVAIHQFDSTGANLLFSKAFGGAFNSRTGLPAQDYARALAVDSTDSVWVVGSSESGLGVPITFNAIQINKPDYKFPAFVLKLSSSGLVIYGSYLGDVTEVPLQSVAVDGFGNPYFVLPSSGLSSKVLALVADGSSISRSFDVAAEVATLALDGNGGLYVARQAGSAGTNCPTTAGSYQPSSSTGCAVRFDLYQTNNSQIFYPLNAASQMPSTMAPGELITFFGKNLPLSPTLTFDGIVAPVVSSGENEITAVVPFGVNAGWTSLSLDGVGGYVIGVLPAVPALFTVDGSGSGQVDATNEDGSANSSSNPAPVGSVVSLYMTGAGAMNPALADGALGSADAPYSKPVLPVAVALNGEAAAEVVAAIQAPGRVAGIVRLDVRIPQGTPPGDASLQVTVGSGDAAWYSAQSRVTVAVR